MTANDPMTDERLAEARAALGEDMSQWGGEYGLELIAEVERLRALTTVDKGMLARAQREYEWSGNIRRVLDAALGTGEDA